MTQRGIAGHIGTPRLGRHFVEKLVHRVGDREQLRAEAAEAESQHLGARESGGGGGTVEDRSVLGRKVHLNRLADRERLSRRFWHALIISIDNLLRTLCR